jgi:hypothetical protein
MAELKSDYIADTLNSRQLLALLFVCESMRKKTLAVLNFDHGAKPEAWAEFLDRFAARLAKLPEQEKVYLLGSHLQSAEELDIYSNATVQSLLEQHQVLLARLAEELNRDPRFTS